MHISILLLTFILFPIYSNAQDYNSGYQGIIELGRGFGKYSSYNKISFSNGYRYNNYFSLNGMVSARLESREDILIPLTLDLRINFRDRKITPFTSIAGGYSFYSDFDKAMPTAKLTFGVNIKVWESNSVLIGIAYEYQDKDKERYYNPNLDYDEINPDFYEIETWLLSFGFTF